MAFFLPTFICNGYKVATISESFKNVKSKEQPKDYKCILTIQYVIPNKTQITFRYFTNWWKYVKVKIWKKSYVLYICTTHMNRYVVSLRLMSVSLMQHVRECCKVFTKGMNLTL